MSTNFILLIFIIGIIVIIVESTKRKNISENYNESTNTYELILNKNGKLLIKDEISIKIKGKKIIILPNVELDTGSSNLVLDYDSTRKLLLDNNDSYWCSKGGWGEKCNPYSYTSNFSGKKITSNFYKGKVSFIGTNYDVTMGNGSTNKDNIKDYTILGLIYNKNKDSVNFNYLNQLFQNKNIPKKFTFKFGNLENGENGEFSFNGSISPKTTFIDYIPNNKHKYILKIISINIDINGEKINIKEPYYGSIDSGSENFTLPTNVWSKIGRPSHGKVSIILSDDNNIYTLTNNTPIRNYDPNDIELNNSISTPYILIGKFLMQNHEVIFDIENKKIGFRKI